MQEKMTKEKKQLQWFLKEELIILISWFSFQRRGRFYRHIIISICFYQDWNKMEKVKVWVFTEVTPNCQGPLEMSFSIQWWNCFINIPGYLRENSNSGISAAWKNSRLPQILVNNV